MLKWNILSNQCGYALKKTQNLTEIRKQQKIQSVKSNIHHQLMSIFPCCNGKLRSILLATFEEKSEQYFSFIAFEYNS